MSFTTILSKTPQVLFLSLLLQSCQSKEASSDSPMPKGNVRSLYSSKEKSPSDRGLEAINSDYVKSKSSQNIIKSKPHQPDNVIYSFDVFKNTTIPSPKQTFGKLVVEKIDNDSNKLYSKILSRPKLKSGGSIVISNQSIAIVTSNTSNKLIQLSTSVGSPFLEVKSNGDVFWINDSNKNGISSRIIDANGNILQNDTRPIVAVSENSNKYLVSVGPGYEKKYLLVDRKKKKTSEIEVPFDSPTMDACFMGNTLATFGNTKYSVLRLYGTDNGIRKTVSIKEPCDLFSCDSQTVGVYCSRFKDGNSVIAYIDNNGDLISSIWAPTLGNYIYAEKGNRVLFGVDRGEYIVLDKSSRQVVSVIPPLENNDYNTVNTPDGLNGKPYVRQALLLDCGVVEETQIFRPSSEELRNRYEVFIRSFSGQVIKKFSTNSPKGYRYSISDRKIGIKSADGTNWIEYRCSDEY